MALLLGLSNELLHSVFVYVDPLALDCLSATCRSLRDFIRNNRLLGKEIYLSRYDDPTFLGRRPEPCWASELRALERFVQLLDSDDVEAKYRKLPLISNTTTSLLCSANNTHYSRSLNIALLKEKFQSAANRVPLLFSSTIFNEADGLEPGRFSPATAEQRQWCAKLHCLYGTSDDPEGLTYRFQPFHIARSVVYDLRGYTEANLWGPFLDKPPAGSPEGLIVDWEKIEAIMIVLEYNMRHFRDHHGVETTWDRLFDGVTGCKLPKGQWKGVPTAEPQLVRQPVPAVDAMDPYGITGTWRRVVCFLDYNDFYIFNFRENLEEPDARHPITTDEAIRLITLKLFATRIEAPGESDNPSLPVVHFQGSSQSMHPSWDPNANSAIRAFQGTVRLTREGEVRWTTLSIFHGEPRWKSEGIQVGGLRSKRGVVGTWFDKDYDRQGPCGPTAFWKLSDTIEEVKQSSNAPYFDPQSL